MSSTPAALACAITLFVCAAAAAHPQHEQQRVVHPSAAWMVAAFTLTDQHGRAFTQDLLRGRWTFVLFGDAHCGSPCSEALAALTGLHQRIARADVVQTTQVLFVSLDPGRDGPAQLHAYLAPYDPRFVAATGTPTTLARLLADWSVAAEDRLRPAALGHAPPYSGTLRLIGPEGAVRAEYAPPFDVLRLTAHYLKTRIGAGKP